MLTSRKEIAVTCATILVLPRSLALIVYPSAAAMLRSPEIANSRPTIRITIHPGTAFTCTSEINAAEMSSLSAMGSSRVPIVVTCPQRRARYPSSRSVAAATRKIASASHSLVTVRPKIRTLTFCATSAATSSGTKKMRAMVRALGRFIRAHTNYNLARGRATSSVYERRQPQPQRFRDFGLDVAEFPTVVDIHDPPQLVQERDAGALSNGNVKPHAG